MKTGHALLAAYGLVLAMGIIFGGLAITELQSTTARLERVVSDSAQTVIDVERLRAASDRLGLAARSYLFTQNARFRSAMDDATGQFRERMAALSKRLHGSPSSLLLERVRELDARGQRDLQGLLSLPRPLSPEEALEAVESRGQPLREQIEVLLEELSRREGLAFRDATHDATLAATRATQLLSVLATIALVVAFGVTIALVRAMRLLARNRGELEQSLRTLEAVNQDLDAFVGRSAHDLRNVIAPLGLLAEVLEHKRGEPAELQRYADRLKRIGRTADGLIESYLRFARAGQPPSPKDSARVRQVLAEVVEDLAPLVAEKRARLDVNGEDAAVLCSQSFLQTVLMNLIGNALKYLDGGVRREVSISVRGVADRCEIHVMDGGPGIPASAQEKIFKPFYRLPGVTAPGMGIGLATVSRIVNAHGGCLSVQSSPGQGSTFVVSLPRADTPPTSAIGSPFPEPDSARLEGNRAAPHVDEAREH